MVAMSPSPSIQHIPTKHGTTPIVIAITRKKRVRRISLRVTSEGEVKATAPLRCTIGEVVAFATKKTAWIEAKLLAVANLYTPHKPAILYRGVMTPLRLTSPGQNLDNAPVADSSPADDSSSVISKDGCLWLNGARGLPVVLLETHLRAEAKKAIAQHLPPVLHQLGEADIPFSLGQAKTRWGSCHWQAQSALGLGGGLGLRLGLGRDKPPRHLRFNWRLAMATPQALKYVVVHEAAHLRHPNHSRQFWQLVASLMSDWREGHGWLRQHQGQLMIDFDRQLGHLTAQVTAQVAAQVTAQVTGYNH